MGLAGKVYIGDVIARSHNSLEFINRKEALEIGYEYNIVEWQKEQYMYLEKELSVDCYRAWEFEKAPMMEHEKYTFHAENGYLTSYTVQEFDGDNPKPGFWDGHHFKISLKRKYDERGVITCSKIFL